MTTFIELLIKIERWYDLQNKSKDELKKICLYHTTKEKIIIKNIIVFKRIKELTLKNPEKIIDILLPVYIKYKNKEIESIYIQRILKINKQTMKELNKRIFLLKSKEEQEAIRNKIRETRKKYYHSLSKEKKKEYNRNKFINRIKKIGMHNHLKYTAMMYKKWYSNLNEKQKEQIRIRRKIRYSTLDNSIKEKYKETRKKKYREMTKEERQYIYECSKKKKNEQLNNMSEEDRHNYNEILRMRKQIYFDNIPIEKRKILYKIRTFKRQLNRQAITYDEYISKKNELINDNKIYFQ
jgi:hypothetical protein